MKKEQKMTKLKKAQLECANWSLGNCLGCSLHIDAGYLERNKWAPIFQTIDKDKVNKPCIVEKGCEYFENFVT
mgnify:CR=1 FL=1